MASVRLKAEITELANLDAEIKRLMGLLKPLRQRKKVLEENILEYMTKNPSVGGVNAIKVNNVEIKAVEKKSHEKVSKDEKEAQAIQLLQQSGVTNARRTFRDLQNALKGDEKVTQALKLVSTGSGGGSISSKSGSGGGVGGKSSKGTSQPSSRIDTTAFPQPPPPSGRRYV